MARTTRLLATAFGLSYVAVGLVGFVITGFDGLVANGDDALLIFEINPFHNIVHIATGGLWLLASRLRKTESTQGVHQGIAIVYLVATVLGAMGMLTMLSIDGLTAPDNLLHLASAIGAGAAAMVGRVGGTAQLSGA